MDWPFLASGSETCTHCAEQSAAESSSRADEGRKHAVRYDLAPQHVPGRGGAFSFGCSVHPERLAAGEHTCASGCIDSEELAKCDVGHRPNHDAHRFWCARAECHQVEKPWPKRRVGDVLASDGANVGACIGTACGDRG